MTITFPHALEITEEEFESLLVTALEGGSNYWYWIKSIELKDTSYESTDEPLSSWLGKELFNNPEFKLNIYDVEDHDNLLGTVTQESIMKAFEKAGVRRTLDFIDGNFDAEDADVIFQYATMGEIVYG